MAREVRGSRYQSAYNGFLRDFIAHELHTLDFAEARAWYARMRKTKVIDGGYHVNDEMSPGMVEEALKRRALLGCNDRYFLLTGLLQREDLNHPWLYNRCREVERDPDGYIDLWARGHGKTSIITIGGVIQELLCNPEITIAIFSVVRSLAQEILGQIKNEFETNDHLKAVFPDVFYQSPRSKGPDGRPAKWSLMRGITVKRKGKPKEATIEAHGLLDGQPTGRHFMFHVYDDCVTQDYLSEDQLRKTAERWQLADNLGTRHGVRKRVAGTRYHFADVYGRAIESGSLKPRVYPATLDGSLATWREDKTGKKVSNLVLLTPANWDRIKRDQGTKTVSAQMLLNPLAGSENTFTSTWFATYEVFPTILNVYIMVDPSKGKGPRSDRTAIAVVGIDPGGTKYLLDGYCHRMKLSERWGFIKALKRKWDSHPGVQMTVVGYEQYGAQDDISVLEDMMEQERNYFKIEELKTPEVGGHSKEDRITRLEPDIRNGRFRLPIVVHHPDKALCYWKVYRADQAKAAVDAGGKPEYDVGTIIYDKHTGLTKAQLYCERTAQRHRIIAALRRLDEQGDVYDVTRMFIDEAILHPFAAHDDFIDACARIYDLNPHQPVVYEAQTTEPLGLEGDEAWDAPGPTPQ